jgi:pimeloyl-ACP methyl ester carboxylesterase
MNPYDYLAGEPRVNLRLKRTRRRWLSYTIEFPSAHPTRYEKNNTVRGEYYQPRTEGEKPLVILVHGMGDQSVFPLRMLARSLAGRGIACFVLYSVFHSSRMPEIVANRLPDLSWREWYESYRISVIDVRQIIDWSGTRNEIDQKRIALIGLSLGGFISAIAMGVDQRIKAGVLVASGGNLIKIGLTSRRFSRNFRSGGARARLIKRKRHYEDYLAQVAEKGFAQVEPEGEEKGFQTDPLTFAPYLCGRPLLMINALWDEVFPRPVVLDFWQASGKPQLVWLPAGHVTLWLWYPLISWRITRFLKANC